MAAALMRLCFLFVSIYCERGKTYLSAPLWGFQLSYKSFLGQYWYLKEAKETNSLSLPLCFLEILSLTG